MFLWHVGFKKFGRGRVLDNVKSQCADIPQAHKQGMYEQYSKLMKSLLDHGMEASRLAVQQEPISSELNRYTVGASTTAINVRPFPYNLR